MPESREFVCVWTVPFPLGKETELLPILRQQKCPNYASAMILICSKRRAVWKRPFCQESCVGWFVYSIYLLWSQLGSISRPASCHLYFIFGKGQQAVGIGIDGVRQGLTYRRRWANHEGIIQNISTSLGWDYCGAVQCVTRVGTAVTGRGCQVTVRTGALRKGPSCILKSHDLQGTQAARYAGYLVSDLILGNPQSNQTGKKMELYGIYQN